MAQALDYAVSVCDPREEYSAEWDVPGAPLVAGMPDDVVTAMAPDPHSAIVALTHDPKLDDMACWRRSSRRPLRGRAGLAGQQHRKARLLEYFDLSEAEVGRLHGPVGLPIGSRTPPEIAVSILAEMTAVKNGVSVARPEPASPASAGCGWAEAWADRRPAAGGRAGAALWPTSCCTAGRRHAGGGAGRPRLKAACPTASPCCAPSRPSWPACWRRKGWARCAAPRPARHGPQPGGRGGGQPRCRRLAGGAGDMPFIQPQTLRQVARALEAGASLAAPWLNGQRGHPVGLPRAGAPSCWPSPAMPVRGTSSAGIQAMVRIETTDPGVLRDVDTPGDLAGP
jgi:hypothetical protein